MSAKKNPHRSSYVTASCPPPLLSLFGSSEGQKVEGYSRLSEADYRWRGHGGDNRWGRCEKWCGEGGEHFLPSAPITSAFFSPPPCSITVSRVLRRHSEAHLASVRTAVGTSVSLNNAARWLDRAETEEDGGGCSTTAQTCTSLLFKTLPRSLKGRFPRK